MHMKLLPCLLFSLISFPAFSQKILISNVTVIDVEKQKMIPNATVAINGNSIESISTKSKAALQDKKLSISNLSYSEYKME